MAREVLRFEAETDPPTVHPTRRDAVIAEIAAIMGCRTDGADNPPLLARKLVDKASSVIACLQQVAPSQPALETTDAR
jgi:hypothetical protein